jgi:hypothetical protein
MSAHWQVHMLHRRRFDLRKCVDDVQKCMASGHARADGESLEGQTAEFISTGRAAVDGQLHPL